MADYSNESNIHTTRRLVYGNEFLLNGSDDDEEDDDTEIYHGHPQNVAETHKLIPLSSSIGASIMMANTSPQVKYHGLGGGYYGRSTSKRYTSWAIIVCTILFMLLLVYIPILQNVQTPRIGELDDIDCDAKQFENCMNSRRTGIVMIFQFYCCL